MGWADAAIAELKAGRDVTLTPRGNSMTPRIKSGQTVKVVPVASSPFHVNDVVLVRCKGRVYLHRVLSMDGRRVLIGNNHGGVNGWVRYEAVYGRAYV